MEDKASGKMAAMKTEIKKEEKPEVSGKTRMTYKVTKTKIHSYIC